MTDFAAPLDRVAVQPRIMKTNPTRNHTPTHAECFARLSEIVREINIAMLTTVADDGTLRSRPMATQQIDLIDGALWFFTSSDSPKTDEILHHRNVNVAYASVDKQHYVSVSGLAQVSRDRAKIRELWKPAAKIWFPLGVDDPALILLRVDVTAAEYWDSAGSKMMQLYGLAKSMVTGNSENLPGENVKIEMRSDYPGKEVARTG